jgi:MarR family transcriptional regulator, 2-MHQ and catechol-resistance regulon repressor
MPHLKRYGRKADLALAMWVKLARASATFSRYTLEDIRSYGLTQPQFGVLESLGHLGEISLGELSRKQLSSGGNITVVVDNLEKEGLVARRHCKEDRRVVYVHLTPKGEKLFREIFARHATFVADLASVLTEDEQAELAALLKKLGTGVLERRERAPREPENRSPVFTRETASRPARRRVS